MFRERFSAVFPKSLPHYGPQEIERGVTDIVPGDHIERLLCALVGLVLNRKKDVEYGHLDPLRGILAGRSHAHYEELQHCLSTDYANNGLLLLLSRVGEVITNALSKKLYRVTRLNGHGRGKARTRSTEGKPSRQ